MSNYLSFDASVKIHQSGKYSNTKSNKTGVGGYVGYLRHLDRADDKKDGIELRHSNENIDPDYTLENESYYRDEDGKFVRTEHASDLVHAVDRRINYAKEHGAKIFSSGEIDTVIIRPLIFQLDEEAIKGHEDTWVSDLISLAEERFGEKNIVGYSIHRDEDSPHIHVVFVPVSETVDEDGNVKCSVSQTKFFTTPSSLASMHKSMREELISKNYDISLDNKPIEEDQPNVFLGPDNLWHKGKGLSPDQLKALSARKNELEKKEVSLDMKENEIKAKAKANEKEAEKIQAEEERIRDEKHKVAEVAMSNRIARQNANRVHKQALQKQEDEREEKEKSMMERLMQDEEFRKFMGYCKSIKTSEGTMYDFMVKLLERYDKKKRAEDADLAIRTEKILEIGEKAEALEMQKYGQQQQKDNASLGLEELNPFDL